MPDHVREDQDLRHLREALSSWETVFVNRSTFLLEAEWRRDSVIEDHRSTVMHCLRTAFSQGKTIVDPRDKKIYEQFTEVYKGAREEAARFARPMTPSPAISHIQMAA